MKILIVMKEGPINEICLKLYYLINELNFKVQKSVEP